MSAYERIVATLEAGGGRRHGADWTCPAHDDGKPSLSVREGDGRALVHCQSGCDTTEVVAALGLKMADLFDEPLARPREVASYRYVDERATPLFDVVRFEPKDFRQRRPNGSWGVKGVRRVLYRLPEVIAGIEGGEATYVVEGEKDVHALERVGVIATCNPGGAGKWRDEYSEALRGAEVVIVADRDTPGRAHARAVAESLDGRARSVRIVESTAGNDAADHLRAGHGVDELVVVEATESSLSEMRRANAQTVAKPALADEPNLLVRLVRELHRGRLVGEDRAAKLVYLATTSRLLDRPVSIAIKGPSSAGKSVVVERVLELFPSSAYFALTAMSERYLAYSDEPMAHRMLVLYEANGMGDDGSYLVRSLLSEGCIRYGTVDKTNLKPKLIEREGPTGLIVTTTAVSLHPENETRLISIPVDDAPAQTAAVMLAMANGEVVDFDVAQWHAVQEWLAAGPRQVAVPFAATLAREIPPVAVRLRRDFGAILGLIRAHALLHRGTREINGGQVIASIADYAAVRDLVHDLVADAVGATVKPTVRETVNVINALTADGGATTVAAAAARLELDHSAAWRRCQEAIERGYVQNLEDRPRRPARLMTAEPMPDELAILPDPGVCTFARLSGERELDDHGLTLDEIDELGRIELERRRNGGSA
jgi:5S rRNA maturation endonuclease (ribonuclease M5)